MKKLLLTSIVALGVVSTANAGAYVSGYLTTNNDSERVVYGHTFDSKASFFDKVNLEMTVGYAFSNGFRLEADVARVDLYDTDESFSDTFAINFGVHAVKGLYDFKVDAPVVPYIGAGLSDFTLTRDYIDFNIVGIIGVSFPIDSQFSLDLQYNRTFAYQYEDFGPKKASYNGENVIKMGGTFKF